MPNLFDQSAHEDEARDRQRRVRFASDWDAATGSFGVVHPTIVEALTASEEDRHRWLEGSWDLLEADDGTEDHLP